MPKEISVTNHARKRVEFGDEQGMRTLLSVDEIVELSQAPFVVKDRHRRFVYSKVDNKTLTLITTKLGRHIITVHGTEQEPSRIPDMLARRRAGVPFAFRQMPLYDRIRAQDFTRVALGTYRWKKNGFIKAYELCTIGYYYMIKRGYDCTIETEPLHRMVVDSTHAAWEEGLISRSRLPKLQALFFTPEGDFGAMPVPLSFELLGEAYLQ